MMNLKNKNPKMKTVVFYVLKIIAYTICAIGCFYQVVSILNLYLSFPTTVFSFVEIMDTLELPAISICTNNRVMLNKLKHFDPSFNQSWTMLEDDLHKHPSNINQTKVLKQKLIDRTIRNLMDSLPVYEFSQLGHQWEDIVANRYFKCATDPFNLDKKCIDYANVIESAQEMGNCFTIFRKSANLTLKNIAIKSGISQSPVIRGVEDALNLEIADQPFHPNEIFRVMINFSLHERTTLNEKTMGHIAIHDENELPSIRNENFIINPGYYYEFYISKETGKYLPYPYVTDCIDYNMKTEPEDQNQTTSNYINVLSRDTCIMDCMAKHTIEVCQCWPPELPFIIIENESNNLKWCSWRDGTNIMVNTTKNHNWFRYCFANHETKCKVICKTKCKADSYEVMRQSIIWPSKERIDHSKKYNISYRECCTLISIRFWSSEQSIQDYQPKYEFVEFISYFGGLLSIWLGFSLVKSYDVGEVIIQKCITYILEYKRNRQLRSITDLEKHFKRKHNPNNRSNRPKVSKYLKTNEILYMGN